METKEERIEKIRKMIVPILKRNGVVRAGIFGSFARGDYKRSSDIDILIEFRGRKSLLDLIGVKQELGEKTGRTIDVITYRSIHPLLKDNILKEEVRIYEG